MRRSRTRKTERSERGSLLRFVLVVAFLAWAFRSFVLTPFSIPSGSMLPTLFIGDYVVVSKWPYGFSRFSFPLQFPPFEGRLFSHLPKRGDVVVFAPPGDEEEDVVKRVIGLPGDVVAVHDGIVNLNGKDLPRGEMEQVAIPLSANSPCRVVPGATPMIQGSGNRSACLYPTYKETLPGGFSYPVIDQVQGGLADDFGPVTVPEGRLFLMGDNRDDSLDSRFSQAEGGLGFVPLDHLIGRAATLFWSTDGSASYVKPWTWFSALRADRIWKSFGSAG